MHAKKRALGRGLDALLGASDDSPAGLAAGLPAGSVRSIPVVELAPNPFQPRQHLDPSTLDELTVSIQEKGVLQPLLVRQGPTGYEIVAGERRWRGAQRAGLTDVPVLVREFTDREMLELALIENIQREELNAVEEAMAYRRLIEEFELTQEQVAQRVGKSRVAVTNSLRLLRLPERILDWIREGRLTAGHAKALLALGSQSLQLALCREIMARGLSVREAERRVRKLLKTPDAQIKVREPVIDLQTRELEQKLRLHLGLQVKILPKSNVAGKIEVYYSSLDDFRGFFDHLGISLEQES